MTEANNTPASTATASVRIDRFVSPEATPDDRHWEDQSGSTLRPTTFADYPGQERAKRNLQVYVQSACQRDQALDHVLLHGPPGLGKTTLARVIARERGVAFYQTSGPSIERAGDLAGILAGIERNGVLFIDEIHRLSPIVEEVLYSAMEDFTMDLVVGQGPTARTVRMPIHPFTLVGATTRVSLLTAPLVSRFGIQERLEFYDEASLAEILMRSARLQEMSLAREGALALARRSRGTPRTANRLLRRVRDFAEVRGDATIQPSLVSEALTQMEIDEAGLEPIDRVILATIRDRYDGGPVGIETLAHTIGEDRTTLEDVFEPFLVHRGFITRGPRGRELTTQGLTHLQDVSF